MKKLIQSLTATLLACCLFATTLASCKVSLFTSGPEADADKSPLVILLAKSVSQDGVPNTNGFNRYMTKMAEAFNETGKGEVVVKEYDPDTVKGVDEYLDDYYAKYQTLKQNDETPDIVFFHRESMNRYTEYYKYITNGDLADLTPYIEQDPDYHADDYVQGVMDGGKVGTEQFFIPLLYKSYSLMSSEEISLQSGGPLPSQNLNFEDFWSAVNKTIAWASENNIPATNEMTDFDLLLQGEAPIIDIQNQKINFDSDFETLLQVSREITWPYILNEISPGPVRGLQAIGENKVCMSIQPYDYTVAGYVLSYLEAQEMYPDKHIFIMPLPSSADPSKHKATISMAMGVSASSKKKNQAYEFIKFCMNSEDFFSGIIQEITMDFNGSFINKKIEKQYIEDDFNAHKVRYMSKYSTTEEYLKSLYDNLYRDITSISSAAPYYNPFFLAFTSLGATTETNLDTLLPFVADKMTEHLGMDTKK